MSTTIAYTDVDGRSYNIHYSYAGTTAKVTQCNAADTASGSKVVIPSTINVGGTDYTVDTITSPGFTQNTNVYSIELPTTMTTLEGTNTFYNTRNLSEVIGLENTGITYLPENAFNNSGNVGNNNVNVTVNVDQNGNADTLLTGDGARELGKVIASVAQDTIAKEQRSGGLLSSI